MSIEYNQYLDDHISYVNHAITWLADHLKIVKEITERDISEALENCSEHDASKLLPNEYRAYDDYFYGGNRSNQVMAAFEYAWLQHQNKNPHHWQYWVLINDDPGKGQIKPLMMPVPYVLEMIADWWAFSWKDNDLGEILDWYDKQKNHILLHPKTKKLVEKILELIRLELYYGQMEEKTVSHAELTDEELEKRKYAISEERKFPMPDAKHVKSAIRFFNYIEPEREEQLAKAILTRMKEYGMVFGKDITVGDDNRFKKYIPKEEQES